MSAALQYYAGPMRPQLFTVVARRSETADTFTFKLVPQASRPLEFLPGQFNMLYLFGHGEVPISLSGDTADTTQIVHTARSVGNVTHGFETLMPGNTVGIRGPFGTAWPMQTLKGRDILFVAGGLGLAPLRPAILYALAHRHDYGSLIVLYGTRNPTSLLFAEDLERWGTSLKLECQITVDHADASWQGRVGVITKLVNDATINPGRTSALICGPEIMMHFSVEALIGRGLSGADIYVSLERNMKCALGHCGHCQLGPTFICYDGPVIRYDRIAHLLGVTGL